MNDLDEKIRRLIGEMAGEEPPAPTATVLRSIDREPQPRATRWLPLTAAVVLLAGIIGFALSSRSNDPTPAVVTDSAPSPVQEQTPAPNDNRSPLGGDLTEAWDAAPVVDRNGDPLGALADLGDARREWMEPMIRSDLEVLASAGGLPATPVPIQLTYDVTVESAMFASIASYGQENVPDIEAVVLDGDGNIVAATGAAAFDAPRPSGSTYKVGVLATALGLPQYDVGTEIDGTGPCTVAADPSIVVENSGGSRGEVSTLQDLTISSSNCGFLRLDEAVGTANTRRTVEAMAGRLDPDVDGDPLPMQVDNPRLTALDEAVMAGTLARGGFAPFPHLVTSFVDGNDGPRFFTAVSSVRSVRADAAAETIAVLAANVRDGTAQAAAGIEGAEAWAKTGTAVDFHTAWFMGGAGEYTAAVWTGWPDGRLMENVFGLDYVTGDSVPGNIWTDVMTAALASE